MKEKTATSTPTEGRDQGMMIFSYLLAGIGLYGGLGWLGDGGRWLGLGKGWKQDSRRWLGHIMS